MPNIHFENPFIEYIKSRLPDYNKSTVKPPVAQYVNQLLLEMAAEGMGDMSDELKKSGMLRLDSIGSGTKRKRARHLQF